jgi:hypothetical protein
MPTLVPASAVGDPIAEKKKVLSTPATQVAGNNNKNLIPKSQVGEFVPEAAFPETDKEKYKSWYQNIYESIERSFLAGFNQTIADMLQTPISAGLELYQMGFGGNVNPNLPGYDPDDHVVGARAVKDLFESLGINVTPEKNSLSARIGEEVAYGMAGYGAVGQLAKGTKYTFGVLEPLLSTVRKAPLQTLLADIGISVPAGAGAYAGQKLGGDTGEALGTLAGAFSPYAVMPGLSLARRGLSDVNRARTALGIGREGQMSQAQDILTGSMSDEALDTLRSGNLTPPSVGTYSTAELLGDRGLLEMEAAINTRSPQAMFAESQSRADTTKALGARLETLSPGEASDSNFVRSRVSSAAKAVQKRMETAVARAQAKIDKLSPNTAIDITEKIAREEFDAVYRTARDGEKLVWSKVGNGYYYTDSIVSKAREIVDSTPRLSGEGGSKDVPQAIKEIAGQEEYINDAGELVEAVPSILQKTESIDEIQALVSRIGDDFSIARSLGKTNRARQLGQLRDSILQSIEPTDGSSAVLESLRAARSYSRRLNEVFYHGPLGQLLGKNSKGGLNVAPELTLERLIGTGVQGKIGATSLRKAAEQYGGVENVDNVIQEYLKAKFASKVMANGQFSPEAANRFVTANNSLDLYPELRAQMLDASQAQRLASSVSRSRAALMKRVENQSVAAKFLDGAEPQAAIKAILGSRTPTKDLNNLLKLARKDPSGNTLKGVQSGLYEILVDRFGTITNTGDFVLTPNTMIKFLDNKTNAHLIKSVFGDDAMRLLREVSRGASFKARSIGMSAKLRNADEATLNRLSSAAGTVGALIGGSLSKLGATYTGKGLLMAGVGRRTTSGLIKAIAERNKDEVMVILEKALSDPAFARELIKPISQIDTAKGEMSLRKFAAINEFLGEVPSATFSFSEELMP